MHQVEKRSRLVIELDTLMGVVTKIKMKGKNKRLELKQDRGKRLTEDRTDKG